MNAFRFRFLLVPALFGVLTAGCALRRTATSSPAPAPRVPIVAPALGEAERIGGGGDEFNYKLSDWSDQGHYADMIKAARLRLQKEPSHAGAQYALTSALYYNGDFAGAATEAGKLVQVPQYQNDSRARELLSDAQTLAKRYRGQTIAPVAWMPNEEDAMVEQWQTLAAQLMQAGRYDDIDKQVAALTANPQMMPSGSWTLAPFFVGLWANDGTDAGWQKSHALVQTWAATQPQSQMAQLVLARSWVDGAWTARGDKPGAEVPEATWTIVRQRMAGATPIIEAMLAKPTAFSPLVYATAQRYGRLGDRPRAWHDDVFERGIKQYPDYVDFYRERSILLLPRWQGGRGEWESQAAKAADAVGQAKGNAALGDELYARIVWGMWDYHTNLRQQTRVDWERTKRGFDLILKRYPGSLAASTIYVRMAHQYHDYPQAHAIIPLMAGRADAASWRSPAHFAQTRNFLLHQS